MAWWHLSFHWKISIFFFSQFLSLKIWCRSLINVIMIIQHSVFNRHIFCSGVGKKNRVVGGWLISTPKALTLGSPQVDGVVIDVIWLQRVDQLWVCRHNSSADAKTAALKWKQGLSLIVLFQSPPTHLERDCSFFYGSALVHLRGHQLCFLFWWKTYRWKCCLRKKNGCNQ